MNPLENLPRFYSGQEVVFRHNEYCIQPFPFLYPEDGQTVRILSKCPVFKNHWEVVGFTKGHDGVPQSFHEGCLFPIQKQSFPLMKFTEILKKEETQILIEN